MYWFFHLYWLLDSHGVEVQSWPHSLGEDFPCRVKLTKTSLQSEPVVLAVSPSVCAQGCLSCASWGGTCSHTLSSPAGVGRGWVQLRSGEDAGVPTGAPRCFKSLTELGACPQDWADLGILWGGFGCLAPLLHLLVSNFNSLCVFFWQSALNVWTHSPSKGYLKSIVSLTTHFSTCEINI